LILLHGGPLILNRSGAPITLTDAGERISFDGKEAVDAQIAATTVQALNLMTRRGQVRSTVRVIHGKPALFLGAGAGGYPSGPSKLNSMNPL